MVNQTVDERGGQTVVPEHCVPLGKLQIGRNDEALTNVIKETLNKSRVYKGRKVCYDVVLRIQGTG